MKIEVLKSEGAAEPYLHTKVLGTFHNALASVQEYDLTVAEQMAEAITFYLYRADHTSTISSDQIHLLIQSVLTATGYGHAAESLNAYRMQRKLQRRRMVVVRHSDNEGDEPQYTSWTKARIVDDLVETKTMDRLTARAIAGAVEEKVMKMGILRIRTSLIRELVLEDTEAILRAEKQLQAAL
jgi:hypothetical protein